MSLSKPHKQYVVTMDKVKYWFNRLNKKVFKSWVPSPRNIILVEKDGSTWGMCYTSTAKDGPKWWDIRMVRTFPTFSSFLECLGHEMVHAYNYWYHTEEYMKEGNQDHGKNFFLWKESLAKVGIHLSRAMDWPQNSKSNPEKFVKLA
jgi:hypothetical protein